MESSKPLSGEIKIASETGCVYCWGAGVIWDEQIKSYHVCLDCGGSGVAERIAREETKK